MYICICMYLLVEEKSLKMMEHLLSEGSTPDQLELRIMLDEVHSQNAIGKYAKVRSLTYDDDYDYDMMTTPMMTIAMTIMFMTIRMVMMMIMYLLQRY